MRYMIEWAIRTAGLTHEQNLANLEALQNAFGKWKPEEGLTVHAFLATVHGHSGYVLVEASDPKVVTSFVTKFGYWNDINVVPMIDVGEAVAISAANIVWARAASKS